MEDATSQKLKLGLDIGNLQQIIDRYQTISWTGVVSATMLLIGLMLFVAMYMSANFQGSEDDISNTSAYFAVVALFMFIVMPMLIVTSKFAGAQGIILERNQAIEKKISSNDALNRGQMQQQRFRSFQDTVTLLQSEENQKHKTVMFIGSMILIVIALVSVAAPPIFAGYAKGLFDTDRYIIGSAMSIEGLEWASTIMIATSIVGFAAVAGLTYHLKQTFAKGLEKENFNRGIQMASQIA